MDAAESTFTSASRPYTHRAGSLCAILVCVSYLELVGIEELTRWVLNPNLEYQRA